MLKAVFSVICSRALYPRAMPVHVHVNYIAREFRRYLSNAYIYLINLQ